MMITTRCHPRAALIGNPSDGYYGRTIAFLFRNFAARVILYESPHIAIVPCRRDCSRFVDLAGLAEDVNRFGYYGGVRLIKAAIKRFHDHCRVGGIALDRRNFTIRYRTDIPRHLGLAGSSAIITATVRALMAFYGVDIPPYRLADLVWKVELEELDLGCGLQDRVAQAYQVPVFMDFRQDLMESRGYGEYQPLDPKLFPPLYVAYRTDLSEGSEVVHNDLRARYKAKDPQVLAAIREWADLALQVRDLLLAGRKEGIPPLLNRNFDLRRSVMAISPGNLRMVELARAVGCSAKFTGSGGAILGTYDDDAMFDRLAEALRPEGVNVIRPQIVSRPGSGVCP